MAPGRKPIQHGNWRTLAETARGALSCYVGVDAGTAGQAARSRMVAALVRASGTCATTAMPFSRSSRFFTIAIPFARGEQPDLLQVSRPPRIGVEVANQGFIIVSFQLA